jgi:hypothetical protein
MYNPLNGYFLKYKIKDPKDPKAMPLFSEGKKYRTCSNRLNKKIQNKGSESFQLEKRIRPSYTLY